MIETISRGPQFKGAISFVGLIVFVFTLIIGIALLANDAIGAGILFVIAAAIAFSLFLDVRGTQIDYSAGLIRAYKQFMWIRYGDWLPLTRFSEIHIGKDTFYVSTYGGRLTGSSAKVVSFDVVLIANAKEDHILLSEFGDMNEGVAFMNALAGKLSLPARNIYRELQESAVNRRARR